VAAARSRHGRPLPRRTRPTQLAKRKAEELEDFGTAADAPAAKYSKEEIEVGAPASTAGRAQRRS